ncbi:YraN family protein [Paenibacillus ginsengihumi]|uniref:YraN family protein n=1 Tax=Paenibacillus ginsengihumi TaxID=431596 RepID=UPI00035CC17E|nr:YraN family protein [Paenibacillus ginsengihumi]
MNERQLPRSRVSRRQLGTAGEQAAENYVIGQGYVVLARNWRCRTGELDLVALEGETLVFIEVRTRSAGSVSFGTPQESVDPRKRRKVLETARVYVHQHRLHDRQIRFDVIAVVADEQGVPIHIELIQGAF